jgi:hypothetical protein
MRFMMIVIPRAYQTAAPDAKPKLEDFARMMEFNKSLEKAGVLLAMDGLTPPSAGARISFNDGKATVTDGPFTEAKEVFGGYWIIQVHSREEAIEWAKRAPMSDGDTIEVRQVQGLADFPADVQDLLAKRYEALKKEAAARA